MQTSKIKIGSVYAVKRDGELQRFQVTSIDSRKTSNSGNAEYMIVGFFVEDRENGKTISPETDRKIDPVRIIGPYEEQAELVERQQQEMAAKQAAREAEVVQARKDRIALYKFVGVEPPAMETEYLQMFRLTRLMGGCTRVDVNQEGVKEIIKRVSELQNRNHLRVVE